jgi:hypothetical protein
MRFPLFFEGSLPSSGNSDPTRPRPSKLQAIWAIRDAIRPQLDRLFETHQALSGRSGASRAARHALIPPIMIDGHRFYALVRNRLKLKCGLKIDLLVNHEPATVVTQHGDLDNRLKTLFDGLRVPTSQQEIKGHTTPGALEKDQYICLLENDAVITGLHVDTMRNLGSPLDAGGDHVRLNIMVTIEPLEPIFENETFQGD